MRSARAGADLRICVTGATGFVGAHLARLLVERGDEVRVTYRDERRLDRLAGTDVQPVKADVLDRGALRRALRGCDLLFHTAGFVGSNPALLAWQINALSPRLAVEAAAAEGVGRVVLTSSVAALGPVPPGEIGSEDDPFSGGGLDLTYVDSKHEGEAEALAAAARTGAELVIVNPSYVLGVPVDRSQPGETSTRVIGNYLRGRLPAVVDGAVDIVHVEDVAAGHVAAAERGLPGERYVLGGHDTTWVDLLERIGRLSGVRNPLAVIPPEAAEIARHAEVLGLPLAFSAEGMMLMAQNWCYSSRKARRELGYRTRRLDTTLKETIAWYRELIDEGVLGGGPPSTMSLSAAGLRAAQQVGLLAGVHALERYVGRRLVIGR